MLTKQTKKVIIYKHSGNESPLRKKGRCARVLELADKHVSEACVLRTYGFDSRFSHHLIGDKADVKITSAFLFFATPNASLAIAFPYHQIFLYKKRRIFHSPLLKVFSQRFTEQPAKIFPAFRICRSAHQPLFTILKNQGHLPSWT